MKHILYTVLLFLLMSGCGSETEKSGEEPLKTGLWRGVIDQQGVKLPFIFEFQKQKGKDAYEMVIHNDTERIRIDEVDYNGDSLLITFNIFDTEIRAKVDGESIIGYYTKLYEDNYVLPFTAVYGGGERFAYVKGSEETQASVASRYQVTFREKDGGEYPAVAKLQQTGRKVSGTFLTETGDYRFLEGVTDGSILKLSAFDGTHLFLFTAEIAGDSLVNGKFWHGKNTYETWSGIVNSNARLTNQDRLTYLKEGYDKISFSFPDLDGKLVSLEEDRFRDRVVILQIFGSWCPNCLDETRFYTEYYNDTRGDDMEIIGLAYENKPDFEYASGRVKKMRDKLKVPYTFLIAGTSDKEAAAKTLPMLNHIMSFPTSIFIDKKGKVRKIHTGFSGPGTGEDYEIWKEEFTRFMRELRSEKV